MKEIKKFSKDVCDELKYYLYRLVDPRNGSTFYVGKGKGNRVFSHSKCALSKSEYKNDDDNENLKYKTIREIKDAGLEVINVIEKYGLQERDALMIESVLIDTYSIQRKNITNKIKGYNSEEPINAITLQRNKSAKEYKDSPKNPSYIIIKVKNYWLEQNNNNRYETTRGNWKLSIKKANKYPYVLSVTDGIVKEVYKINKNGWEKSKESERIRFTGVQADDSIRNIYIDKKIPEEYRKKGLASPCLYSKY